MFKRSQAETSRQGAEEPRSRGAKESRSLEHPLPTGNNAREYLRRNYSSAGEPRCFREASHSANAPSQCAICKEGETFPKFLGSQAPGSLAPRLLGSLKERRLKINWVAIILNTA